MRAITLSRYGGPEALVLTDLPRPAPGKGEVLLRVHAAAINPVDWKLAGGAFRFVLPQRFPLVPGMDVAGTVEAVGKGVTTLRPGDRVHGRLDGPGACAEYALARVEVLVPIPEGMTMAEAAALPLAGMTALQALRDACRLPLANASQRVLVVGASGGVGHLGVQLAKAAGATVVGVCSTPNVPLVQRLGADAVLDYTQPVPYAGQLPFDVVLDCVSDNPGTFMPLLTPRGHYAAVLPGPRVIARSVLNVLRGRQAHAILLRRSALDLRLLDGLWGQGRLHVALDAVFPLAELAEAWRRSMTGRAVGKIVVEVAPA
ncbi:MAG: NAD(P)-dependent alcohol dehydrogenase [Candidatus Sericytochromatia bacterium]|nr:NAD(P)-dependent alcohol dehydrogenase [Candidatus Sericytochromatia bacterium]